MAITPDRPLATEWQTETNHTLSGPTTMSNMSYCRFQNTVNDLRDCEEAIEELMYGDCSKLSEEELDAAKDLVSICFNIVASVQNASDLSEEDFKDAYSNAQMFLRQKLGEAVEKANETTEDKSDD